MQEATTTTITATTTTTITAGVRRDGEREGRLTG